jgi:hypothetical protein
MASTSLACYEMSQRTSNMIEFLATSWVKENMQLKYEIVSWTNRVWECRLDWTGAEYDAATVTCVMYEYAYLGVSCTYLYICCIFHMCVMYAHIGVSCTYLYIRYIIHILVCKTYVADMRWTWTNLRVHSIFTLVTHDLCRLQSYLNVEKNTVNKLKGWNAKRLDFSIML